MSPARLQSPGVTSDYIHDDLAAIRSHSQSRSETPSSSSSRENRPLPPPPRPLSSRRTRTPFSNANAHTQDGDEEYVRPRVLSNTTNRLLARLLAREEKDARKIESIVSLTSSQLEKETSRANDAERRALSALTQLKNLTSSTRVLESESTKLRAELMLYKNQLEQAQREILRAQEVVDQVEREKREAEAEAARLRGVVRREREERVVSAAREEGYREGLRRGLQAAREGARGWEDEEDEEDVVVYERRDRGRGGNEQEEAEEEESDEEEETMRAREREKQMQRQRDREREAARPPPRPPTAQARPASRTASRGPGPSRAPTRASTRTPHHVPDVAPHAPSLPVPTLTTPLRMPSPHHADPSPAPDSGLPRSPEVIHPIPVYQVPVTPPDGWVPSVEVLDDRGRETYRDIHVPPPHELGGRMTPRVEASRAFPSAPQRPPSTHNQDSFYASSSRPPRTRDYAYPVGNAPPVQVGYMMTAPSSPPRSASRTSTRVSEYEILSAPGKSRSQTPVASQSKRSHTPGSERRRSESTQRRSSSPSGPRPMRPHTPYGAEEPRQPTSYFDPQPPTSYFDPHSTNASPRATSESRRSRTPAESHGSKTPAESYRSRTPAESLRGWTKTPVDRVATRTPVDRFEARTPVDRTATRTPMDRSTTRTPLERTASKTPLDWLFRRRARRTDSTPPNIRVEPPSGSVSSTSSGSGRVQPHLLSPEHASQPLPEPSIDVQMHQVPSPQSQIQPQIFGHSPDGRLPLLFVPTGPVLHVPPPEETFRIPTPGATGYYGDVTMKDVQARGRAGSDASMESAPLNRPFSVFND